MTTALASRNSVDAISVEVADSSYQTPLTPSIRSVASAVVPDSTNNISTLGFIRVVLQKNSRSFALYQPVTASENGEDVMRELKILFNRETSGLRHPKFVRDLFWTATIDIGTLSTYSSRSLEAQTREHEVIISVRAPSAEFTAAFDNPSLLNTSDSFLEQYPTLIASPITREALCINQQLNKKSVMWSFCGSIAAAIAIGTIVGVACNKAELAVAIASGLIGIAAVFGGLLLWVSK